MQIELMAIHHVLSGWLKTPDAPICQLSLAYGEKRMRPCLPEEIQRMREFMKPTIGRLTCGSFMGTARSVFGSHHGRGNMSRKWCSSC
jgi:hypothetical protein